MPEPLPFARPVLFPLWAVIDEGAGACGCIERAACDRIGKHPRVRWGAVEWPGYARPPEPCGYAIKTGSPPRGSGLFVVDCDDANAIAWFCEKNGGEPATFTVHTARGAHYYFLLPPFPVRRSIHELHPKIDIVGEHWWVVGPGSRHKSGAIYTVVRDEPPATAPDWLIEWPGLRGRTVTAPVTYPGDVAGDELAYRREKFVEFCKTAPPAIQGQGGDQALWRVVQRGALDLRLPNAVILDVIREHYDPRCQPPWGASLDARIHHKAHSAKTQSVRPGHEPISSRLAAKLAGHAKVAPKPKPWAPTPKGPSPKAFNQPPRRRTSAKGAV